MQLFRKMCIQNWKTIKDGEKDVNGITYLDGRIYSRGDDLGGKEKDVGKIIKKAEAIRFGLIWYGLDIDLASFTKLLVFCCFVLKIDGSFKC